MATNIHEQTITSILYSLAVLKAFLHCNEKFKQLNVVWKNVVLVQKSSKCHIKALFYHIYGTASHGITQNIKTMVRYGSQWVWPNHKYYHITS